MKPTPPEEALDYIEKVLPPGSLNNIKALVFRQAWEGKGYAAIAEDIGYDTDYIKGVAAQLWKSLSRTLGEKVTKKNFRPLLLQKLSSKELSSPEPRSSSIHSVNFSSVSTPCCDWGTATDVSIFYGRKAERLEVKHYILTDHCRLVALLGLGGMGKTALSVKVAEEIQDNFDYIIWRSLRNAPPLDSLLSQLIAFVSDQQETKGFLRELLKYLRSSRCLIVLDNVETILQPGRTGYYRSGYEEYGELFRAIGETAHSSCLILTSREKPPEIAALEGVDLSVRSLYLQGSPAVAKSILATKGLRGTEGQKQELSEYYGNIPLALKIVATSIQDLFDGDIGQFLHQGAIAFNGIRRLLDRQFQRLTPLERKIMTWLAINREWTPISQLHQDLVPMVSKTSLLESLESLTWRSLLEKRSGHYTQLPLVMEYVTDNFIGQIYQELTTTELDLFLSYALIKTTVNDYIRDSQKQLILEPIISLLRNTFSSPQALESQFHRILARLHSHRTQSATKINNQFLGYGAGNLLNLCTFCQIDLTGYDFSSLPIWHGYLRDVKLPHVNFADADFAHSVFTQTFGSVLKVVYTPNGKLLATGDSTGGVRLWDLANDRLQFICGSHHAWTWALAISPNGQILASGGEDEKIILWDTNTGQCLKKLSISSPIVWSLAFSPDGQTLAIGSSAREITLWEINSQCLKNLAGHTDEVHGVAFSTDGRILASSSHDGTIKLWDLNTEKCLQTLKGHSSIVYSVAFSPILASPLLPRGVGGIVASSSHDSTIKLWDLTTGKCLQTLSGHRSPVFSVVFSPDGQTLASSSEDRLVKLWEVNTGKCLRTLIGHQGGVWSVAFSPDGQTLVSGSSDRQVKLWDMNTGNSLKTLVGYVDYVYTLAWSPNSQIIATGSPNKEVRLWDVASRRCLKTLIGHEDWVYSVAFAPDGQTLATASLDRTIKLWDINTQSCIKTLRGHESSVLSVAWSPDGKIIASGSADRTVRLWAISTGKCLRILPGHEGWILSVAFHPDSQIIASAGIDHTLRLWNIKTGNCDRILQEHQGWVWSVAFSPNGQTLASGSADGTIKLWDIKTGKAIDSWCQHTNQITSIAFSPISPLNKRGEGGIVASGSYDRTIRLWDSHTGECLRVLSGHTGLVFPVAFSPDGKILASGSEDETIRLWDVKTGESRQILRKQQPYEGMNISGASGLTKAQKAALKVLGAVELD